MYKHYVADLQTMVHIASEPHGTLLHVNLQKDRKTAGRSSLPKDIQISLVYLVSSNYGLKYRLLYFQN